MVAGNTPCICGKSVILLSTATVISTSYALWSTYKFFVNKFFNRTGCKHDPQKKVNEMMHYHYGGRKELLSSYDWIPDEISSFQPLCAEFCAKHFTKERSVPSRVLDIGCGVGRTSFELARYFDKVVGLDNDPACIAVCQQLKTYGRLVYSSTEEGDITAQHIAEVEPEIDRNKVIFENEDMANLPNCIGKFGCVLASNVLCQTTTPRDLICELRDLVVPDGILVIATTYDAHHTQSMAEKDRLGGVVLKDGSSVTGFEALQTELLDSFEFLDDENIPMLIRKHSRALGVFRIHVTAWKKKETQQD